MYHESIVSTHGGGVVVATAGVKYTSNIKIYVVIDERKLPLYMRWKIIYFVAANRDRYVILIGYGFGHDIHVYVSVVRTRDPHTQYNKQHRQHGIWDGARMGWLRFSNFSLSV